MVACVLAAAVFLGVSLVDHTDDGCPIEIHCAVCVAHLAGLATQVSGPSLAPASSLDFLPPDPLLSHGDAGEPSTLTLRGPPAV